MIDYTLNFSHDRLHPKRAFLFPSCLSLREWDKGLFSPIYKREKASERSSSMCRVTRLKLIEFWLDHELPEPPNLKSFFPHTCAIIYRWLMHVIWYNLCDGYICYLWYIHICVVSVCGDYMWYIPWVWYINVIFYMCYAVCIEHIWCLYACVIYVCELFSMVYMLYICICVWLACM